MDIQGTDMSNAIDEIIGRIMQREGGYVDHPNDRGGPTNHGVTIATLRDYRGEDVTAEDVENLSADEAREIYHAMYWNPGQWQNFDHLSFSPAVAEIVFDCSIHHGPRQAVRFVQRSAGASVDGMIGPQTIEAVSQTEQAKLAAGIVAARAAFFGHIISRDHSQAVFAHGWCRRLGEMIELIPEAGHEA